MAVLTVTVAVRLGDGPPIVMQRRIEGPSEGPDATYRDVAAVIAEQGTYALLRAGRSLGLPLDVARQVEVAVHDRGDLDKTQNGTQTA